MSVFFFFFFCSQGFVSYNLNLYTQNQSKLEKTLNRAITSLVRKDLKGIGPAQPITLSLPVGFSRGKESICQVFDIQRRDKSQNTRRFNSRITGRYRQLYIQYSFSHTFYRVYSEYSIFCRYMQGLNFTCNINKKKKRMQSYQAGSAKLDCVHCGGSITRQGSDFSKSATLFPH